MSDEFSSQIPMWEGIVDSVEADTSSISLYFGISMISLLIPIASLAIGSSIFYAIGYASVLFFTYPILNLFRRSCEKYESLTGDPAKLGVVKGVRIISTFAILLALSCATLLALSVS